MARRTAGMLVGLLLVAVGLTVSVQLPTVAGLATDSPPPVAPGTISTVAGGSNGDGGPATIAALGNPFAIAYAPNSDLYILSRDLCTVRVVHQGIISTFAGSGSCGYAGDGGAALNARFNRPEGIAVNAAGEVFVADTLNCRVRKVSNGVVSTVAGTGSCGYFNNNGPALTAGLNQPSGIAFSSNGDLIIADEGNCRLRRLSNDTLTRIAGNGVCDSGGDGGSAIAAQIGNVQRLAVAPSGAVVFVENRRTIRRIEDGVITTIAGLGLRDEDGPAIEVELGEPDSVAVSADGEVFVSEPGHGGNRVRRIDNEGFIHTFIGLGDTLPAGENVPLTSLIVSPGAMSIGPDGRLAVVEVGFCRVRQALDGLVSTAAGAAPGSPCFYGGDGGLATRATFSSSIPDIEVHPDGSLYAVDQFNFRIRRVTDGVVTTAVGNGRPLLSPDGSPAAASIDEPSGVEVTEGVTFFSEGCRVRAIVNGMMQGVAGDGTCEYIDDDVAAAQTGFEPVTDFEIDGSGTIWIAGGCRVRTVAGGVVHTVAGIGVCGSANDGMATSALVQADRIEVDADGLLYILDRNACAIRRVDAGQITTVKSNVCARDIAVGASGDLFVARGCVVDLLRAGAFERVAGTGSCGYTGDGGPALQASLQAHTLEFAGDVLYVAGPYVMGDWTLGVVREIQLDGALSTPTNTATPTTPFNTTTPMNSSTSTVTPTPTVTMTSTPVPSASATPCLDADNDGLSNCVESQLGTNPSDIDSDDDGVLDGLEVLAYGTDPLIWDSDDDGLGDGAEVLLLATDPMVPDTDVDGCPDGTEVFSMAMHGGDRNPLYAWDFYDVNGTRTIDLQDTLAILQKFGKAVGAPGYDAAFDRYAPDLAKRWRTALANNGIDLNDALTNLHSFGHSCV